MKVKFTIIKWNYQVPTIFNLEYFRVGSISGKIKKQLENWGALKLSGNLEQHSQPASDGSCNLVLHFKQTNQTFMHNTVF